MKIHPKRPQLLVIAEGNTALLFHLPSYELVHPGFQGFTCASTSSRVRGCFSPDGNLVVTGSESGSICIWECKSGLPIAPSAKVGGEIGGGGGGGKNAGRKRRGVPLTSLNFGCTVCDIAWAPHEHTLILASIPRQSTVRVSSIHPASPTPTLISYLPFYPPRPMPFLVPVSLTTPCGAMVTARPFDPSPTVDPSSLPLVGPSNVSLRRRPTLVQQTTAE
jgi:WD40 repeat protein